MTELPRIRPTSSSCKSPRRSVFSNHLNELYPPCEDLPDAMRALLEALAASERKPCQTALLSGQRA